MKEPLDKKCYVRSMALVSCQKPLSDEWMAEPCPFESAYVRAQEPNSKEFIVPSEARRMSRILKRTVCTSLTALNEAGIHDPNAIITGTGMGCMENSEKFLIDMATFGENCLKPSLFMQSTHNTIGSLIGIVLKCHGYNNTYSHEGISFESALLDGFVQLKLGVIRNALIGSHDENTPFSALMFERIHPEYRVLTETSMSAVISSDSSNAICEVASVCILHGADIDEVASKLNANEDKMILLGVNDVEVNDNPYLELLAELSFKPVCLQYKNIFGDNFSSSAAGFYAAARIIERQTVPPFMLWRKDDDFTDKISGLTIVNRTEDSTWAIIRLKAV